jgi:hypothetical protein
VSDENDTHTHADIVKIILTISILTLSCVLHEQEKIDESLSVAFSHHNQLRFKFTF